MNFARASLELWHNYPTSTVGVATIIRSSFVQSSHDYVATTYMCITSRDSQYFPRNKVVSKFL